MTFTLRPYQAENVTDTAISIRNYKRTINCIATGGGKTKIAITICMSALSKGRTVLFLTESDKIYKQLDAEIHDTININASTKLSYIAPNKLYLAMAQTLARREKLIAQFMFLGESLLIINDECHIGTATKLLLQLPKALLIGLSATPHMKWAKHLPLLYNSIVVGKQPEWLVENGYLMPYRHAQVTAAGISGLVVKGGEYTEESQERIFDTANAHKFIMQHLTAYAYVKCMIFCASIKSAEHLHTTLSDNGYQVATQHSNTALRAESEQSYSMGKFKLLNSGVNICISIASLNKGFDFPPVDLILLNRATTSLPLYLQMCGRASRLSPETGKTVWTVLDYGGNGKRHGRWDYTHDWANLWNKLPKKREGVAPVKECPKCFYLLHPTAPTCPNCGYVFPASNKDKDDVQAVKIVMLEKQRQEIKAMKGRHLSELTAVELAKWGTIEGKKTHAIRVAKAMAQSDPLFLEQFGCAMGYKRGWADYQAMNLPSEKIDFYDKKI
jgi:superfamily II DNA or RNA helicase